MGEFPSLAAFLEHVSLVMEAESGEGEDRVSIMTLHAAKGLEFDIVFLPGWEEGLFPHQRALDENGRAGLEEERRLAYVGLTRARRAAKIYFAANRRVRGLWQSSTPSRFIDELPADHVEAVEAPGRARGLRRLALRSRAGLRFALRDAGLAARPGQRRPRRGPAPGARRKRRRASSKAGSSRARRRRRNSPSARGCSTSSSATATSSPSTGRS